MRRQPNQAPLLDCNEAAVRGPSSMHSRHSAAEHLLGLFLTEARQRNSNDSATGETLVAQVSPASLVRDSAMPLIRSTEDRQREQQAVFGMRHLPTETLRQHFPAP